MPLPIGGAPQGPRPPQQPAPAAARPQQPTPPTPQQFNAAPQAPAASPQQANVHSPTQGSAVDGAEMLALQQAREEKARLERELAMLRSQMQQQNSAPPSPQQQPLAPQPIQQQQPQYAQQPQQQDANDGRVYRVDPRTGIRYEVIPETQMGNDGRPLAQVEDFNDLDLVSEAQRFLGHLRVPPDKAEQARLREQRAQLAREQQKKFVAQHKDDDTE